MVTELTQDNSKKELYGKTPALVDFYADWCGPCQMMKPVFEKLSRNFKGKLNFLKLNTEEFPELAQEYGVQGIPCLILIKNGKETDRIVGFMPESALKEKIQELLG